MIRRMLGLRREAAAFAAAAVPAEMRTKSRLVIGSIKKKGTD